MYENIIKYGIMFGPTILFALIVLIRTIIGYFSGGRRQVIFVVHSIIAFSICLILYFILVENKFFDKFILDVVNKFMGEDGLEEALGVNPNCKTMREVIIQYIPSQMGFVDGLELILRDNGAYLLALVNVCYHIILAFVLYFVYLLLDGIMFIIYLCAYSERKHRRKKNQMYEDGIEETPYYKHKKYGATIGLARGLIRGLIVLSFIGTTLFIISGVGTKNRKQYKTNNETYDLGFTIYKEIGNYGEHGIFKVLNMCKDKNDVPYYLYAADLVYQGGLKDDSREINTNIYLREELNAYVEFSTDTFDLLMKYGSDEITSIILGNYDGDIMDAIIKIMANPKFQAEFKLLINSFDAKTYFVNFALSLVDSICKNVDEVGFMSGLNADAKDVISIAFKPGYLSDTIPFEHNLKANKEEIELGYIKPSSLLTANDAKIVLNAILEVISLNELYKDDKNYALKIVDGLVSYVKKLSIVDGTRSDELNPVFKRLYAFVDSKYLVVQNSENKTDETIDNNLLRKKKRMEEIIYKSDYYNNIDWVNELNLLVNAVEDVLLIYEDVYIGDRDAFTATLAIFDEKNANYLRNIKLYHELITKLEYSKILGEAASSLLVSDAIEKAINENVMEDFKIPKNIVYATTEKNGEVYHGELYYFLSGIEKLCINNEEINVFDLISNSSEISEGDVFGIIKDLSKVMASTDSDGAMYAEELLKSNMLRALLSSYVRTNGKITDDFEIFIDDSIIENNMIDYNELVKFFSMAPEVLDLVEPLIDEESSTDTKELINLIKSDKVKKAIESKIFEGSFSSLLYYYSDDSSNTFMVFPEFFVNKRRWVSTKTDDSEIKKLIYALNALDKREIDINNFIDGNEDKVLEDLKKLDKSLSETLLDSAILYYSMSKYLCDNSDTLITDMPLVIPNVSIIFDIVLDEDGKKKENYNIDKDTYRIDKKTLTVLLSNVNLFAIDKNEDDSINTSKVFVDILNEDKKQNGDILNNNIINATIALSICSDSGLIKKNLDENIIVPEQMKKYATKDALKEEFYTSNPWKREFKNLLYGSEYLLGEELDESFDLNNLNSDVEKKLRYLDDDYNGNNRLDEIYKSNILAATFTKGIKDKSYDPVNEPDSFLVHTDLAYRSDMPVYRIEEMRSLVKIVKKTNEESSDPLESLGGIPLFDENDEVLNIIHDSYLMCASITKAMRDYNKTDSGDENVFQLIIVINECYYGTNIMTGDSLIYFLKGIRQMTRKNEDGTEKVITIDYFTSSGENTFNVGDLFIPWLNNKSEENMTYDELQEYKENLKAIRDIEKSKTLLATITNNLKIMISKSGEESKEFPLYFINDNSYCQKIGGSFYKEIEKSSNIAIMTNKEFESLAAYEFDSISSFNFDVDSLIANYNDDYNYPNLIYNIISYYCLESQGDYVINMAKQAKLVIDIEIVYIIKGGKRCVVEDSIFIPRNKLNEFLELL